MTVIQLFKDRFGNGVDGYLYIKEDTNIPINISRADILDFTKKSSNYSKTVTIIGDTDGSYYLNDYFDVNVLSGDFDVNKIQMCHVIQNGVQVLQDMYFQLIDVEVGQSSTWNKSGVLYKVSLKSELTNFYGAINGKKISDISFADMNHRLDSGLVANSYNNTTRYTYILPYFDNNKIDIWNCIPSIYGMDILDRIITNAGYQWEWASATSSQIQFDKLVLPFSGGSINAGRISSDYEVILGAGLQLVGSMTASTLTSSVVIDDLWESTDVLKDNYSTWNTTEWTAPFSAQSVTVNFNLNYTVNVGVTTSTPTGGNPYNIRVLVKRNGVATTAQPTIIKTGSTFITLNPGDTSISNIQFPLGIGFVALGDIVEFEISLLTVNKSTSTITNKLNLNGLSIITSNIFEAPIVMNDYLPKMNQDEFLKNIAFMYNLIFDIEEGSKKIIIMTRDDYYDSGVVKDLTENLIPNKYNISWLSSTQNKLNIISYKTDKDPFNQEYFDNVKEVYGESQFLFDNQWIKGIKRNDITFAPTAQVYEYNNDRYLPGLPIGFSGLQRILLKGNNDISNQYQIVDYTNNGVITGTATNIYPIASHFDDVRNPQFDINFDSCDYYFYNNWNSLTKNNLYNLHWRRTFNQLNSGRMLTGLFYFTELEISNIKLNDKIYLLGKYWNINKIIDYNANIKGPTQVELISADDNLKLKFRNKITFRPEFKEISKPYRETSRQNKQFTNLTYTSGDTLLLGIGNTVGSDIKDAVVIGDDNNIASKRSVLVVGSGITQSSVDFEGIITRDLIVEGEVDLTGATVSGIRLDEVLSTDNETGGNNIVMSNGDTINAANGGGQLDLRYGGNDDEVMLSNDGGAYGDSFLYLSPGFVDLSSLSSGGVISISTDESVMQLGGGRNQIVGEFGLRIAKGFGIPTDKSAEIQIRDNASSNKTTDSTFDNRAVFIGTKNSTIYSGVVNSVVLGGSNIQAIMSNTVYTSDLMVQGDITLAPARYLKSGDIIQEWTFSSTTTATASTGTNRTYTPSEDGVYSITADILAFGTTNSNAYSAKISGTFKRISGTVTQIGTLTIDEKSEFSTATSTLSVTSGTSISSRITGESGTSITWRTIFNIVKSEI